MEDVVDLIIVNYNTGDDLRGCLHSIEESTRYPYRLTIIDNASGQKDLKYLRSLQSKGSGVIFNQENVGCARAWNQGIRSGSGKYILFLNPDTLVKVGWLTQLVDWMESDPSIAVTGAIQVNKQGIIIHAGMVEEGVEAIFPYVGQSIEKVNLTKPRDCIDVGGACYLIRRGLVPIIGYFDERFFLYAEETDYSFRARKLGYRVICAPVVITHFKDGAPLHPKKRAEIHAESCRLFDAKWNRGGLEDE